MSQMFVLRGSGGEHLGWGYAANPEEQTPVGGTVFLVTGGATVPPSDQLFEFDGDDLVPIDPGYPDPSTFALEALDP